MKTTENRSDEPEIFYDCQQEESNNNNKVQMNNFQILFHRMIQRNTHQVAEK